MTTAYIRQIKAALPKHLTVHATVMRRDGGELTAEDLAAAAAVYPPTRKQRADLDRALAEASAAKPAESARKPAAPRTKATKAPAKHTKRAAAKRR